MNRINLILLLVCLVGLALSTGCENAQKTGKFTDEEMTEIPLARRAAPPAHSDGLALSVKSETITIHEILTPVIKMLDLPAGTDRDMFEFRARPVVKDSVISNITEILLYQEARKDAPENIDKLLDSAVDNEVKKFIASYDDNYALAQEALAERYRSGGMGYGEAKQICFEALNAELKEPRKIYQQIRTDQNKLDGILESGRDKARAVARQVTDRVRNKVGL